LAPAAEFLGQSAHQLAPLGTGQLPLYFAEPAAADFARKLFGVPAEAGQD
jgi:hypothetical protein